MEFSRLIPGKWSDWVAVPPTEPIREVLCAMFRPVLLATLTVLSACRDPKVASYRVPKETPTLASRSDRRRGQRPRRFRTRQRHGLDRRPTAGGDAPRGRPRTLENETGFRLRKGSYAIAGANGEEADMAITAFPGDVGGNLANVNRWRGQLGLQPIGEAELGSVLNHVDIGDLHVDVVEFVNTQSDKPQRMIGAIVPFNGATWFSKLTGPDALVAKEKAGFSVVSEYVKTPTAVAR